VSTAISDLNRRSVAFLGDVCEVLRGSSITKKKASDGNVPVIAGGLKPAYFHNTPNRSGEVITVSGSGANAGFVNYYDEPIWASDCSTIQTKIPNLNTSYVYKFLLSIQNRIYDELRQGAAQPHVYPRDLKRIHIPIPTIDEQKRIVAVLDQAFAALDRARLNIKKNLLSARSLFPSALTRAFAQDAPWNFYSVGKLIEMGVLERPLDGNHGDIHPKKADFVDAGVPFIMASELSGGVVDQENCYFISREQADSLRKGFAIDGDVLLSHKGTIGRAAILATDRDYVMLTPQVTYYRVADTQRLSNVFLYYCFNSAAFQKTMIDIAKGGATRAYIGITRQLELKIPLPCLSLQLSMIEEFRDIDRYSKALASLYESKLKNLDECRQSLLNQAFSGQPA